MSPTDFDEIVHRLPFILTTEQLPEYDLSYLGRQKVDELNTYVFDVKPKVLVKGPSITSRAKSGRPGRTLQIVVVNGIGPYRRTPPPRPRSDLQPPLRHHLLPSQIDGKYWFPTYIPRRKGNAALRRGGRQRLQ